MREEITNPISEIRIIAIVINALLLSKDFLARLTRCWMGVRQLQQ